MNDETTLHPAKEANRSEPVDSSYDYDQKVSWLRRLIRWVIRLSIATIVLLGVAIWVVYESAQKEPEFYQAALAISREDGMKHGDEFETRLLDLQNAARANETWQAEFTELQINGWLANDFQEKFPNTLPQYVSDPRVGLAADDVQIAFRFDTGRITGIVQAEADVFCTEVPGQSAVRIKKLSSGLAPIPITKVADRITETLRRLKIGVSWTEVEGDPVVLLDLPPDLLKIGDLRIELESVQLLDQKVVLTGRSTSE